MDRTYLFELVNVTHSVKMSQMSPNALLGNGQFNVEKNMYKYKHFFRLLFKIFICMVNLENTYL